MYHRYTSYYADHRFPIININHFVIHRCQFYLFPNQTVLFICFMTNLSPIQKLSLFQTLQNYNFFYWYCILLEDVLLPLEQSIIDWPHCGIEDGFFINVNSCFHSWCAEMNCCSPIPRQSLPHHHRRWVATSLNFCFDLVLSYP